MRASCMLAACACCCVEANGSGGKKVRWKEDVEVLEFARLLGGSGGVPTDGTWATLGLGSMLGESTAKLLDEIKEEAENFTTLYYTIL